MNNASSSEHLKRMQIADAGCAAAADAEKLCLFTIAGLAKQREREREVESKSEYTSAEFGQANK